MWPSLMERGSQPALDHTHTPDVPPVRTVTLAPPQPRGEEGHRASSNDFAYKEAPRADARVDGSDLPRRGPVASHAWPHI